MESLTTRADSAVRAIMTGTQTNRLRITRSMKIERIQVLIHEVVREDAEEVDEEEAEEERSRRMVRTARHRHSQRRQVLMCQVKRTFRRLRAGKEQSLQ